MRFLLCVLFLPFISFCQTNEIKNFTLKNVDGKMVSLSDYPNAKGFVVIFTCNHCPFAKLYPERLNELNINYEALGVPLIAISSMDTMSYEEDTYLKMIEKAEKEKFSFPYLYDPDQLIAKMFNAQKTPHAFVIWKVGDHFEINYSGAIDDNGMHPKKVEQEFVKLAIEELLSGKEVSVNHTFSVGCQIYFRK